MPSGKFISTLIDKLYRWLYKYLSMTKAIDFHRIAKALADPRRFEVFEMIAQAGDEMCCGSITDKFPVSQATISHHLKELAGAGLIEVRADGQFRLFRVRAEVLTSYIDELQRRARLSKSPKQKTAS